MAPCGGFPETGTKFMVESLVSSGDRLAMMDKILGSKEDEPQEDPLCGWGNSVCPPRPNQSRGPNARRKTSKLLNPDTDPSNVTIRLVSEDFGVDHYRSAWKANVEPGTYRYIANNGFYRMAKFSSYGPDWVTVKRSRVTERAPVTSFDIKQAHKMLKKDLDSTFKLKPVIESSNYETTATITPNAKESQPDLFKQAPVMETKSMTSRAGASCYDNRRPEITLQRIDSAPNLGSRQTAGSGSVKSEPLQDSATRPQRVRSDAFSVAPMARADTVLRPLEKLTPHQKRIDRRMSDPDRQTQHNLQTEPRSPLNTFGVAGYAKKTAPFDLSSVQLMNQAENDILSRLRNGLHVSNKDDGKSVACSILNNSIKDYSRLLAEKVKSPLLGPVNGTVKSLGVQRRGPALSKAQGGAQMAMAVNNGAHLLAASTVIGAPSSMNSGLNPASEAEDWALPEISGKRIAVAATLHQRIL